jgi:nascent polypeptide-associated complex subunit alpha
MMPNIDPRTMKNMMAKMGIKSSEVSAERVIIEAGDKNIIIENPQITKIEAQGTVSFQISGDITETAAQTQEVAISEEDVDLVAERTGVTDKDLIRQNLKKENGDIAQTIIDLTEQKED